jgi:ubiquinone/menaquinone biosynthesis C-methylase UbiE
VTRQKDVFVANEADEWFSRNLAALESIDWSHDPVCMRLATLAPGAHGLKVLEVGCGDGSRLQHLAAGSAHQVYGVDPSEKAVTRARERGVEAVRSTADRLPFADSHFDILIFGFCLYLCDDEDLLRIACEADRVLANPGWLLILDFDARAPFYRPYHHRPGILSRKMDYKSMFTWHPLYTLASYEKFAHTARAWTDDPGEWVSLATLRKCRTER